MKKQRSITNIISKIFAVTLLVQILILLSVLYIVRVPEKVRNDSFVNFDKNISESFLSVERALDWKEPIENFYGFLRNHILAEPDALHLIEGSKQDQLNFIKEYSKYLVGMLNGTQANGVFLIVENNDEANDGVIEREGLYIRSIASSYIYGKDYEIMIKSSDIDLDIGYVNEGVVEQNFKIDLSDDNSKYYTQLKNKRNYMVSGNGYYSTRNQIIFKEDVITYSLPIFDNKGNLVVVVGIDYKLSNFERIVPGHPDITYILGFSGNDSFVISPTLIWGKELDFDLNNKLKVETLPSLDKYYKFVDSKDLVISLNQIDLYDIINPYNNEQWVFLGIIGEDSLIGNASFVENTILAIIAISLIFGGVLIYLISIKIGKPIKVLSDQIRNRPKNDYVEFDKSNVEEINNLIRSFETLTYDVMQYSNKLTSAINVFSLGIYFYQQENDEVYCTQAFLDMVGSDLFEGNISRKYFDIIYHDILGSYFDDRLEAYRLGNDRWVKLEEKSSSSFTLGILTDITEQVDDMKRITKELDYDGFTKLYNRIAFQKNAKQIIYNNPDKSIAVIMWDMDKLKYINDRYGHDVGDKYIMEFANIIRELEKYDGIVARRSGDEFFAIITGTTKTEIINTLDKIKVMINKAEIEVEPGLYEKVRASFGIAWYPENGRNLESLLDYADKKLYQSKFEFNEFTNLLNKNNEPTYSLIHYNNELAKILDGDYITFAYQPIVDAKTGEVFGYEMLMRIFSDILTDSEKLMAIATHERKLLNVEELTFTKGFESYNVFKPNIKDKKIFLNSISNVGVAEKAFKEISNLNNGNLDMLVVELTNYLGANKDELKEKIDRFKSVNANVAIDNFKLEYISKISDELAIDFIKVDVSIIDDIENLKDKQKILEDIIDFARINNYKVIAVGVKNYDELKIVINSGVDYLQGYYIAGPTVKPSNIKEKVFLEIKKLQK